MVYYTFTTVKDDPALTSMSSVVYLPYMEQKAKRNWEIVGLTKIDGSYIVDIKVDGVVRSSGERPSEFGDWGLTRKERGILRRGLTSTGKDRKA